MFLYYQTPATTYVRTGKPSISARNPSAGRQPHREQWGWNFSK